MRDASLDAVLDAIRTAADDRGFLSANVDQVCTATGYSRATIKRAMQELAAARTISIEPKRGPGGGFRIQLRKGSATEPNSEPNLSPIANHATPLKSSTSNFVAQSSKTCATPAEPNSEPNSAGVAWRQAKAHEIAASGADLLYTKDVGNWRRLNATMWIAPNGDAVSVRSMTPELRARLRTEHNPDGTPNAEAVRAIQGILDR